MLMFISVTMTFHNTVSIGEILYLIVAAGIGKRGSQ